MALLAAHVFDMVSAHISQSAVHVFDIVSAHITHKASLAGFRSTLRRGFALDLLFALLVVLFLAFFLLLLVLLIGFVLLVFLLGLVFVLRFRV